MNTIMIAGLCLLAPQQESGFRERVDRAIAELNAPDPERLAAAGERLRWFLTYPRMALKRATRSGDVKRAARAMLLLERGREDVAVSRVRGVAPELGLAVINVGRDDGVASGMEYIIVRGGRIVCSVTIDRVDRNWSSGRIGPNQSDPRVGDEVFGPASLWKRTRFAVVQANPELLAHFGLKGGLTVRHVGLAFWDVRVKDVILGYRTEAELVVALKAENPPTSLTVLRRGKRITIEMTY